MRNLAQAALCLAWVLWFEQTGDFGPLGWFREDAADTREECEIRKLVAVSLRQQLADDLLKAEQRQGGDGLVMKSGRGATALFNARGNRPFRRVSWLYQCWPDTVDPRQ